MKIRCCILFGCLLLICPVIAQQTSIVWPSQSMKTIRAEALEHLQNGNIDSIALRTFSFKTRQYHAFSSIEQEWILLIRQDYPALLTHILSMERQMHLNHYLREFNRDSPRGAYQYSEPMRKDDFNAALRSYVERQLPALIDHVQSSRLAEEDRLYLHYYLIFTRYQFDYCDEGKQRQAYYAGNDYLRKYPKGDFYAAVRAYSGKFITPGNWGFDTRLVLGGAQFFSGMERYYQPGLSMDVSIGLVYKRAHLDLVSGVMGARVREEFTYQVAQPEGRYVNFRATAIRLGYDFPLSDRILAQPFLHPSYLEINFGSQEPEINVTTPMTNFALRYGLSLMFDFPTAGENECKNPDKYRRISALYFGTELSFGSMDFSDYVMDMSGGSLYFGGTVGFYFGLTKRKKLIAERGE